MCQKKKNPLAIKKKNLVVRESHHITGSGAGEDREEGT
jgi:hypothetical protein